jgi:hypothetical protein
VEEHSTNNAAGPHFFFIPLFQKFFLIMNCSNVSMGCDKR